MKDIRSLSFLIIVLYQNIAQVNTLRCAHTCTIEPIPFGSLDPIKTPCKTVDVDTSTTVCSVFLAINFATGQIDGALNEKPRTVNQSLVLHLSSLFYPDGTTAYINYQCATTNDCDEEFVRETISSAKWFQLNETKVRTDINSLLFETDIIPDRLICDRNLSCSWLEQCVAELSINISASQAHQIKFNNQYPCDGILDSHVKFDQYFHAPATYQDTTMKVHCNRDECNQRRTVEQVYDIIQHDFILPLNYSAYVPIPSGSDRMNDFGGFIVFLVSYLLLLA